MTGSAKDRDVETGTKEGNNWQRNVSLDGCFNQAAADFKIIPQIVELL